MSKIEELLRAELEKLSSVRERFAQRFGVNGTITAATTGGHPVKVSWRTGDMETVASSPMPVGFRMPEVKPKDRAAIAKGLNEERSRLIREEERCAARIRSLASAVTAEIDLIEWGLE